MTPAILYYGLSLRPPLQSMFQHSFGFDRGHVSAAGRGDSLSNRDSCSRRTQTLQAHWCGVESAGLDVSVAIEIELAY